VTDLQRADLARLRRSQRYLLALINDLLNLAKIEAGHLDVSVGDVPVAEVMRGLEALISPQLRAKALTFDYVACAPGLVARADVEKVRQVLLNLLSNAIKFTDGGGAHHGRVRGGGRVCGGARDRHGSGDSGG